MNIKFVYLFLPKILLFNVLIPQLRPTLIVRSFKINDNLSICIDCNDVNCENITDTYVSLIFSSVLSIHDGDTYVLFDI